MMFIRIFIGLAVSFFFLTTGFCEDILTENYKLELSEDWSVDINQSGANASNGDYSIEISFYDNKEERDADYDIGMELLTGFGGTVTDAGSKDLGDYAVTVKEVTMSMMGQTSVGKIYLLDSPDAYFYLTLNSQAQTLSEDIVTEVETGISNIQLGDFETRIVINEQSSLRWSVGEVEIQVHNSKGVQLPFLLEDNKVRLLSNSAVPVIVTMTGSRGERIFMLRE